MTDPARVWSIRHTDRRGNHSWWTGDTSSGLPQFTRDESRALRFPTQHDATLAWWGDSGLCCVPVENAQALDVPAEAAIG